MDHLKQFGSHAYVRIPKSKDTQELIFVGYSDTLKCWRFLDKSCDSIVISKDAKFVEFGSGLDSFEILKIPIDPDVAAEKEEIFNKESAQFQEEIQIQPHRKSSRSNFGKRPIYLEDYMTHLAIHSGSNRKNISANKFVKIEEKLKNLEDQFGGMLDTQKPSSNEGLFRRSSQQNINRSEMNAKQSKPNQSGSWTGHREKFKIGSGSSKLEEEC